MSGDEHLAGKQEPLPEVTRRLARYLRANPHAEDTKEGITQWWLGMEPSAVERVELALARLRAAGLVEAVCAADGRVRFRRVAYDASVDAQLDRLISMPIPAQE